MDRREVLLRFTGQAAAFVIAITGLVIGALLVNADHNLEGLAVLFGALAPIIGAFVYRQVKSNGDGQEAEETPS